MAGKVNPFIYHYRIEVRLDEKNTPAEKKSRRALVLYLIQFSAVLLAAHGDLNRDAVIDSRIGVDLILPCKTFSQHQA